MVKKIIRLREVDQNSQSLSGTGGLTRLLRGQEVLGLTRQFGAEAVGRLDEDHVRIIPPIPRETIAAYGDALVKLAQGYDPSAEISFLDEVDLRPARGDAWLDADGP